MQIAPRTHTHTRTHIAKQLDRAEPARIVPRCVVFVVGVSSAERERYGDDLE